MPIIVQQWLQACILTLMLNLFFQKSENWKITLPNAETYIQVSHNLDSQYYVLERVKGGDQKYLHEHYFLEAHPQIVNYYTSWNQQDTLQEELAGSKKPKDKKADKKGIMSSLLSKKSKAEQKGQPLKEAKQEVVAKTTVQDVLYIQLQSFLQVKAPSTLSDVKEFMALIFLLAMRVYETFKCWPHMLPVIVEARKFKFIKKGGTLYHELVTLFEIVTKDQKQALLAEWSQPLSNVLRETGSEEQRKEILGEFLKRQLEAILQRQYILKLRKGQEMIPQTILILNPHTLMLKEQMVYIKIDEFQINYFHKKNDIRQIVMEHSVEQPITLEGQRNNLIIKYLKQFMMG